MEALSHFEETVMEQGRWRKTMNSPRCPEQDPNIPERSSSTSREEYLQIDSEILIQRNLLLDLICGVFFFARYPITTIFATLFLWD